ncbi:MAG TPA: PASTA domain-containing protein [Vicinamibacterales bacterium]|jgi:beta-lactam-binding protein with PASTA domain|nr:PASTA domain-containing protein [Vicinamibacterales bacterium]
MLTRHVWTAGKRLILAGALIATYALFAVAAARIALKTRDVVLPDLRGRTVNEANAALAELGVRLKVEEGRRLDPKVPVGQIVLQEPAAGSTTRRERSVRVWISAGQRLANVPGVVGDTDRSAQMRLQQDGFQIGTVAEIRTGGVPAGAVVAQEPPAAAPGTSVSLLVNRGERGATYVMPDLIGVNGDRAADILRRRGFRVALVGDHPYPGVPAGIVIRQAPQGGFQIAPGEPISLEVSR